MVDRTLLRRKLLDGWRDCISDDYPEHIINSEHGLQAVLYHRLRDCLPKNWTVFVEPSFAIENDGKSELVPDLLICNSRRIIAVIELKYQPRVRMDYKKDLRTLAALAGKTDEITMENVRYLGLGKPAARFQLADDALFVWAGVHYGDTVREGNDLRRTENGRMLSETVGDCFYQLHAVTCPDAQPDVFSLPGLT